MLTQQIYEKKIHWKIKGKIKDTLKIFFEKDTLKIKNKWAEENNIIKQVAVTDCKYDIDGFKNVQLS
jgi:hypothetical protein